MKTLRTSRYLGFVCLCLCLVASAAHAQNPAPTHPLDGEYIKEWLVLGSFFPNNLDTDFLAAPPQSPPTLGGKGGGEANVNPKEGDTVTTADGKTLQWKRYTSKGNIIDLVDAIGNHENATAYAFCFLQSETTSGIPILVGSDDGVAVWLNGRRAHHNPVTRSITLDSDAFEAPLLPGLNRCLMKVSHGTENWGFAMRPLPPTAAIILGRITDEKGAPIPNADVQLEQTLPLPSMGEGPGVRVQTTTDATGKYQVNLYPVSGPYDLSATAGDRGGWQLGVRLREGERQTLSLTLKEAISLSGNVLALDNTPHAAIAVQVVTPAPLSLDERHLPSPRGRGAGGEGEPTVVATTLSEESGRYRFINLLPGRYQVRVYTGDGDVYYGFLPPLSSPRGRGNKNSLPPSPRPLLSPRPRGDHRGGGEGWGGGKTLQVQPGKTLSNIDFRVAPFKKGIWKTYNVLDGLAHNSVTSIYQDKAGAMWFGTGGGGVSRYDGMTWTSFDTRDGLAGNIITLMHQDSAGFLWLATVGGISRYRRRMTTPYVQIFSVRTDALFTKMDSIPLLNPRRITAGKRVSIEYNSIDFQTLPSKRQYRVKMSKSANEQMSKWLPPTKETTFDWTPKQPGQYRFEVQAIDGEHNDSEPAALTLKVVRPWWVYALWGTIGIIIPVAGIGFYYGKRLQTQRAIAQQFNPYIAGRVVGTDLFYGRSDILTDIERTLANNCFLIYGERRIGKTSLQHQLKERLQKADDPTYKFVPAYIDLQGVAEDDFFRTIAAGVVEACRPLSPSPPVGEGRGEGEGTPLTPGPSPTRGEGELALRLNEARDGYTYRDLTRDLRTIIDHLKANETKAIKIVLLMDEVDTLNTYSLRTNLNLRGLFMGPLKENLVLVMSGLYLKMDWSAEGGGSPPFNFLSREIQIQPLDEESARKLITEPIKGFYSYEPKAIDQIIELSELRPFTIQGFCLRAVNRVLADGRTKITLDDIEAIKESVLAEVNSIRGERAGTSLPASFNEALSVITDLKAEVARLRGEAA